MVNKISNTQNLFLHKLLTYHRKLIKTAIVPSVFARANKIEEMSTFTVISVKTEKVLGLISKALLVDRQTMVICI